MQHYTVADAFSCGNKNGQKTTYGRKNLFWFMVPDREFIISNNGRPAGC